MAAEPGPRVDEALFRPVRPVNAFEETVERLLQAIKLGLVLPGHQLPAERDLAATLAVSRVTLREAIRALQQAGYLESKRGRYGGTFVAERLPVATGESLDTVARRIGGAGLADVLLLREVLEVGAAEVAARRELPAGERAHLRERLAECATADLGNYRRADSRLHLAIADATGSPLLTAAVADQRMRVNELLDAIRLLERNLAHSNRQHAAIVAAVLSGDPVAARQLMAEHLQGTVMLLHGFLS